MSRIFAALTSLAILNACDSASAPGDVPTPSAAVKVVYAPGDTASFTSTNIDFGSFLTNAVDTSYWATITVAGPSIAPPYDPERPQVDLLMLDFLGPRFDTLPTAVTLPIGVTGADTVDATTRANSVGHLADSGTVTIVAAGSSFRRVTMSLWFRATPTATYHVTGVMVVPPPNP